MSNKSLADYALTRLLDFLATQEAFVFLETTKCSDEDHYSYLFLDPIDTLVCAADESSASFFEKAGKHLEKGRYLAGWISYEFGYLLEQKLHHCPTETAGNPLAVMQVFKQPHIYEHRTGLFSGAGPWPSDDSAPVKNRQSCSVANVRLNQDKENYLETIHRIKSYIEAGDTYQVNYTLKCLFDFSGSPAALYRTLRCNQSVAYGAYIKTGKQHIMSFSPELFFKKQGQNCLVRPMKGTMQRGRTADEDRHFADFLKTDRKNRSENIMIVDLLRNDLGRLCEMGTVKAVSLFDVESFETLHQMTSTVRGTLRPDITLTEMFRALFPCGSVTGAPKIRTMEIINELELEPRGVYTGGIGFFTPTGDACFNVPIRTLLIENGRGEMGIGSGIIHDSDPEKEWEECLLKGKFLTRPEPEFELIETLLWRPDRGYWLPDLHLDRLLTSAGYFGFNADRAAIISELEDCARNFSASSHQRVRLTLKKDGNLAGVTVPCQPPAMISFDDRETNPDRLPRIIISDQPTNSMSPFLYHKTTRRQLYDAERKKATKADYYEVIFLNEQGLVTEGAITNIFIKKNNEILTPLSKCGLLNGILRQHLIDQPGPFKIKKTELTRKDLEEAEAIYLGNSVRGLVRVSL